MPKWERKIYTKILNVNIHSMRSQTETEIGSVNRQLQKHKNNNYLLST
jgi:hypothetical protein